VKTGKGRSGVTKLDSLAFSGSMLDVEFKASRRESFGTGILLDDCLWESRSSWRFDGIPSYRGACICDSSLYP
jgi:hypothetical protein